MPQTTDDVQKWLIGNKGNRLEIRKEEDSDLDNAAITLEDVVLIRHHDTDGYLSDNALLLKGEGAVNTAGGVKPLPYDFYEIPLTERWSAEFCDQSLQLQTERGTYSIKAAGP